MSELTLTVIRLGFLAVLWLFVLSAISVIRSDLFGKASKRRQAGMSTMGAMSSAAAAEQPPKMPKPKKPSRSTRGQRGIPSVVIVAQGANAGAQIPLGEQPLLIGRGPECEIPVDDEYVSTRHAVLRKQGQTWYAEDLGSTNGTFVGESRIQSPTMLGPGMSVRVGKTVLELRK